MYKEKSKFNKNKVSELNLSASLHLLPGTDARIKYARQLVPETVFHPSVDSQREQDSCQLT